MDKRVRSAEQIAKRFGRDRIIGTANPSPATIQHLAAALVARAQQHGVSAVVLVPASASDSTTELTQQLNEVTRPLGVAVEHLNHVSLVDARALVELGAAVAVVTTVNRSTMTDVIDTVSVIESAQKPVLGVILAN